MRHAAVNQSGDRRGPLKPAFAALDLGTHNCRLLIASPYGSSFKVVDSFSRIVRLGEGLGSSGGLSCEAVNRTIGALKICANKIKSNRVVETLSVATEACRQANNGFQFLDRVKAEIGLNLETISPSEEAQLTLEGCINLLDQQIPYAIIFDIGGGSTEIMWVKIRGDGPPHMVDSISIPSGVVSLCEQFGSGAISQPAFTEISAHFIDDLDAFDERNGISKEIQENRVQMLGTSGTVTTLGAIYLDLPRYDRSKVDGLNLGCENIVSISAQLAEMDCLDRAKHPCIGQGRADLVVMGCAVLSTICKRWPLGTIRVADRGIREGLLNRMIIQHR